MASMTLSGLLEVVIDETGTVMSASHGEAGDAHVRPGAAPGDPHVALLARHQDGKPVRYRQVLEIVLRPATPQE